ncbi:hypothetical protein [Metabacillus malikii]|uniref:Uncharacterized membrane protein YidH (DUF202 family) n=1 Tax=Metabacillus malikii TaxID=1504265 RepID=A0ABT9ZF49_9BACI|nr:hypothetical protein [Metabacillus malikii]MDQ0230893.1 uncharacterized membrane protein YidH (DUF202 family) [Metabacillus malikii]
MSNSQTHLGVFSLSISGILFVLYPAIRPFSDEKTLQGASAFASNEWLLAHLLAIFAFTLLPLGIYSIHSSLLRSNLSTLTYWALISCIIGVGLTLPFYGGETFGLQAIGQEAFNQQSADLLSQAEVVRSGTGLILFLVGLLLLALSSILVAIALWKSYAHMKWSGIPLSIGMLLYIPQFFFNQPIRVAHGFLVAVGCVLLAVTLWKITKETTNNKVDQKTMNI